MENKKIPNQLKNKIQHWTSSTEYYKEETGEQITKHEASKMIKVRITKQITVNQNKTKGHVKNYAVYKRDLKLDFGDTDNQR